MLDKITDRLTTEPAIRNAILALAGLIVIEVLDVIELSGGTTAAIAAAILGQAGITRGEVTPVAKLDPKAKRVTG